MSSNCSTHLYSKAQVTSENFTLDFLVEFSFWHQVWTTACFPGDTSSQEPTCQCRRHRDVGLIPGLGRSPGGGRGKPLQHCCLENAMDRGAWRATVSQKVFQKVGHNWVTCTHMDHGDIKSVRIHYFIWSDSTLRSKHLLWWKCVSQCHPSEFYQGPENP